MVKQFNKYMYILSLTILPTAYSFAMDQPHNGFALPSSVGPGTLTKSSVIIKRAGASGTGFAVGTNTDKNRITLLFDMFRKIAENPNELSDRMYWTASEGVHAKNSAGNVGVISLTRCGYTSKTLMASFFGFDTSQKLEVLFDFKKIENEDYFRKALSAIEKNSLTLKEDHSSDFFVYSFGINGRKLPSNYWHDSWTIVNKKNAFVGHEFVVIQYLDEGNEIKYLILQSFLDRYCLKDYLEETKNKLDTNEFMSFLEGLKELLISEKWTDSLETFYTKYFKDKDGFQIGKENPCSNEFQLVYGRSNISELLAQNENFESFMKMPDAPQIIGRCLRCENKLKGVTAEEADAEEERNELIKLDNELRKIFDKKPILENQALKFDLNSLGLNLTETGLIKVPARDETKLILKGKNVEFVNREITLKEAAEDVIAKFNEESLHWYQYNHYDKVRLPLICCKEPFKTYDALGWLPIIIDAIIKKSPDSKLVEHEPSIWYTIEFPKKFLGIGRS